MSHNMTAGRLLGAAWQCICVTRCRTEVVLLFVGSRDGKWLLFHQNESAFLSEAFLNNDKWKVNILYTQRLVDLMCKYSFISLLISDDIYWTQDLKGFCVISVFLETKMDPMNVSFLYYLPYINSLKKPFRYKKASSLSKFTLWRTWQISNNSVTNVLKNTTQI